MFVEAEYYGSACGHLLWRHVFWEISICQYLKSYNYVHISGLYKSMREIGSGKYYFVRY